MPIKDELEMEARKWAASPETKARLKFLDSHERSGENWLCVEFALHLEHSKPEISIELEPPFPNNRRKHCDLVLNNGHEKLWVEVAHIWSWHQAKGREKCMRDVERVSEGLFGRSDDGALLVFLISRPRWFGGKFERWINDQRTKGNVLLVECPL